MGLSVWKQILVNCLQIRNTPHYKVLLKLEIMFYPLSITLHRTWWKHGVMIVISYLAKYGTSSTDLSLYFPLKILSVSSTPSINASFQNCPTDVDWNFPITSSMVHSLPSTFSKNISIFVNKEKNSVHLMFTNLLQDLSRAVLNTRQKIKQTREQNTIKENILNPVSARKISNNDNKSARVMFGIRYHRSLLYIW